MGYRRNRYEITVRDKTDIAEGSISDISVKEDISLAEAFAGAKRIILLDVSGSMEACDTPTRDGHISRHEAAEEQVRRLQKEYQGSVALFCFSDHIVFCPDGVPNRLNCGTAMAGALRYVHAADNMGIGIDMITDGGTTDGEDETIAEAAKFKSRINCIYIGPEGDFGQRFLMTLARTAGGKYIKTDDVGIFYEEEKQLLLTE